MKYEFEIDFIAKLACLPSDITLRVNAIQIDFDQQNKNVIL